MSKELYKAIEVEKDANGVPLLSPKQLLEIEADPAKMESFARMLGAVNLDNLFRVMQGRNVNAMAKIEFQKLLNKLGRLEPETDANANAGPQVVINITRAKDRPGGGGAEGEIREIEGVGEVIEVSADG